MPRLSKVCPECKREGTVKRIVYGMPGPDFDFEKYVVGGCIPDDAVAEYQYFKEGGIIFLIE